jgi:hypothetical protein
MKIRWLMAAGLAAAAGAGIVPGLAEPGEVPHDASESVTNHPLEDSADGAAGCPITIEYLDAADGSIARVAACRQADRPSVHPYEQYPEHALASLAYADAKAAEVLGMRLRERDPSAALRLIVRSSALAGGDIAPIRRYSNAFPQPVAVDGVPIPETVRTKFVLAAVAEILGDGNSGRADWESVIRRHSSDADTEISLLNARTHRIMAEMQRVREQVGVAPKSGG